VFLSRNFSNPIPTPTILYTQNHLHSFLLIGPLVVVLVLRCFFLFPVPWPLPLPPSCRIAFPTCWKIGLFPFGHPWIFGPPSYSFAFLHFFYPGAWCPHPQAHFVAFFQPGCALACVLGEPLARRSSLNWVTPSSRIGFPPSPLAEVGAEPPRLCLGQTPPVNFRKPNLFF